MAGSIGYRERSQRWEARWRDEDGRQKSKLFDRKRDAVRHLALVQADTARGEYLDPARGRITVKEVAEQWMANSGHLKPGTAEGYRSIVEANILPVLGRRQVGNLRTSDIREFVTTLSSNRAPGTVRNTYRVLKQILDLAVEDNRIKVNPCQGVKLPKGEHQEQHFLSAKEIAAVAEAMPERYRTLVYLAGYSGLRWGELAALRWKRVDLMRRTIRVEESVRPIKGGMHFGPPKTAAGRRTVRIPKFLVAMLTQEQAAVGDYDPDAFVFQSPRGGVMSAETVVRRHFRKAAETVVPDKERLRFHDLRHTCAALLIAQGAHPKAIQRHLGHSTITVTLDRYGHLFPEESDRLADALDATFQAANTKPHAATG